MIIKFGKGRNETINELNDAARPYLSASLGPKVKITSLIPELFPQVTAALFV